MTTKSASKSRKKSRPRWVRWTKRFFAIVTLLILPIIFAGGCYWIYELNEAKLIVPRSMPDVIDGLKVPPSEIVSSDGKVLYTISAEYRLHVPYNEIPENMRNAIVAAEDKRFFSHSGVDVRALGRALFTNVQKGRFSQGASTIPMQLAKRLYTSNERSLQRKIKDAALAWTIDEYYEKEDILELYCNQVYFGSGAHGVAAAADVYFGKTLDELTLGECAMIARMVRRPSEENPFKNMKVAIENRDIVLQIMLGEGMITKDEYEKAKAEKPTLKKSPPVSTARLYGAEYFVQHVMKQLEDDLPGVDLKSGGYKVITTLDWELQQKAEKEVKKIVDDFKSRGVTTAAIVLINDEGQILAEVGGVDFNRNEYNVITQGRRQPGSSFKPFVYATALATGAIGPHDEISNEPFTYIDPITHEPWTPKNANGKYGEGVSVRSAIAYSINVPAVRTIDKVGPGNVVAYARDTFGFKSQLKPFLSLALGTSEVSPLEMAEGYSVFALRGDRVTPYPIKSVQGPDGQNLKVYRPNVVRRVLNQGVCDQMDHFLRGVVTMPRATGVAAGVVTNARGKTGTTQESKDAWFCGYSDGLTAVAWVANEQRKGNGWEYKPMSRVYGGSVTVKLWAAVMKEAYPKHASARIRQLFANRELPDPIEVVEPEIPIEEENPEDQPPANAYPDQDEHLPPWTLPPINPDAQNDDNESPPQQTPPPAENQPPPPKPKPETQPEKPKPVEFVEVEICADSKQVATRYCPETVTRRFAKDKAPKAKCNLHGLE